MAGRAWVQGCTKCLYITDYSFNVILRLDIPRAFTGLSVGTQVPLGRPCAWLVPQPAPLTVIHYERYGL
jgi:hypothetical protein